MRLAEFKSTSGDNIYVNIDQIVSIRRTEGRTSTSTEITTTANANGLHTLQVREPLAEVIRLVEDRAQRVEP